MDGRFKLLLGLGRAPTCAADGLLQTVTDDGLVPSDGVELSVTDTGCGTEEAFGGDTSELRDLVCDEGVVGRRSSSQGQHALGAWPAEALQQPPGATLGLEVEDDLRGRGGTPRPGLPDVITIGVGLAEEHQLDGLLDA